MIEITVNFADGTERHFSVVRAAFGEAVAAAKLLCPGWTSMVATVTNSRKEPTENA